MTSPADTPKVGQGVDAAGNPVVDPTLNVRELVVAAIQRQDDLRGALLDGLEKYIDTRINGSIALSEERHLATRRELENIERRRIEHKEDTKEGLDTAMRAASEAVAKSEKAAGDQLRSVEGTVDDLKDRVRTLETQQQTKIETRSDSRSSVGMVVGIIGSIFGFISIILTIIVVFSVRGGG